jgi:cytochrome P450
MLPRVVPPGGADVCGVWLPGGTPVSIQAYAMNRDGKYFHRPDSFAPERWLAEATGNPDSPFFGDQRDTFHPFSLGPRSCLGQNLAWAELRLIMAKLVWTFDFTLPQDPAKRLDWEDLRTFLLVEKKPIYVEVKLRPEMQVS